MKKVTIIILIAVLAVVGIVYYLFLTGENTPKKGLNNTPKEEQEVEVPADWGKYESEEYDFSLNLPSDWGVTSTSTEIASIIMVAPEGSITANELAAKDRKLNPNTTHIAIYPEALPTDGVLGRTSTTGVNIKPSVAEGEDYLLEDGERWASYFDFEKIPQSWDPAGFVWAGTEVQDLEVECRRNGEVVPEEEQCHALGGEDRIVRNGRVDAKERETVEKILSTFEFTAETDAGVTYKFSPASRDDSIRVEQPVSDAGVNSPMTISGKARGSWFFEGQFFSELVTQSGSTVATTTLTTSENWMTEDFVPFSGEIEFEAPNVEEGKLLLKKANPSGLKENEEIVSVPVKF